jgi:hypothetical protein
MRFLWLLLIFNIQVVFAQTTDPIAAREAYLKTINTRTEKIVATLGISDSVKFKRVQKIIASQYCDLNDIYTLRDSKIKNAKAQHSGTDKGLKEETAKIDSQATADIKKLHPTFLSKLSRELTAQQVDKVKDGMTYDVLHVTYNGYNQMILTLTDAQKKQIMDWLIEARELAMDAESSDKKHAWFGKYKGRINNYLSAAGYDLKKEGEEWEKRRNAAVKK